MRVKRAVHAPGLRSLNSQLSTLNCSIWQKPNGAGSDTLYANSCRFYFTPLAGVLFTFPSRYWFTIGCQGVFSLIRWSGRIRTEFHVHRATWDSSGRRTGFRVPGSHGLWPIFPHRSTNQFSSVSRSRYPGETSPPGLGSSAFARHY